MKISKQTIIPYQQSNPIKSKYQRDTDTETFTRKFAQSPEGTRRSLNPTRRMNGHFQHCFLFFFSSRNNKPSDFHERFHRNVWPCERKWSPFEKINWKSHTQSPREDRSLSGPLSWHFRGKISGKRHLYRMLDRSVDWRCFEKSIISFIMWNIWSTSDMLCVIYLFRNLGM